MLDIFVKFWCYLDYNLNKKNLTSNLLFRLSFPQSVEWPVSGGKCNYKVAVKATILFDNYLLLFLDKIVQLLTAKAKQIAFLARDFSFLKSLKHQVLFFRSLI